MSKVYRLIPLPITKGHMQQDGQLPPSKNPYYAVCRHLFDPDATRLCGPKQWSSGTYTHWLEEVTEPADPFAEWRGVPVTTDNLKTCSLFIGRRFFNPIGNDDIRVEIGENGLVFFDADQDDAVGLQIHPQSIASLCEAILCFDPTAFEKGGEG